MIKIKHVHTKKLCITLCGAVERQRIPLWRVLVKSALALALALEVNSALELSYDGVVSGGASSLSIGIVVWRHRSSSVVVGGRPWSSSSLLLSLSSVGSRRLEAVAAAAVP